ncbi:hypothetical protein QY97_00375 [Bacillus thermotolerans]|nr:hypothetical protein QY97_00375 [Bacillus thermotolerans]
MTYLQIFLIIVSYYYLSEYERLHSLAEHILAAFENTADRSCFSI